MRTRSTTSPRATPTTSRWWSSTRPSAASRRPSCPRPTRCRTSPARRSSHQWATARTRSPTAPAATSTSTTTSAAWPPARSTRRPELAAHLDEPFHRQRRHVLRRLRRPELPRNDADRRRDHDHWRRRVPLDERGLPAGHEVGADVPRAVRDAALTASLRSLSIRGADRNRTGVNGFAGRCVTTPPRRRGGV